MYMTTASRPTSESEATALSVQPDDAKAKTPSTKADAPEYKIADLADDGKVFVKLPDGRHVAATLKDGVEVKRHAKVKVSGDEDDLTVTSLAS
jgi:hypothetical protein